MKSNNYKKYCKNYVNMISFSLCSSSGVWIQGLTLARQMLYHLTMSLALFALVIFQIGSHFCLGHLRLWSPGPLTELGSQTWSMMPALFVDWSLHFLSGLTWTCDPPNLCILSSCDYRLVPQCLVLVSFSWKNEDKWYFPTIVTETVGGRRGLYIRTSCESAHKWDSDPSLRPDTSLTDALIGTQFVWLAPQSFRTSFRCFAAKPSHLWELCLTSNTVGRIPAFQKDSQQGASKWRTLKVNLNVGLIYKIASSMQSVGPTSGTVLGHILGDCFKSRH
jgi:hypothetical protein